MTRKSCAPDFATYSNRARVHHLLGDAARAWRDIGEAIRLEPDFGLAYVERGSLLYAVPEMDAVLRDFEEAIRLKPDYSIAYVHRGLVRGEKGDITAAIPDFESALQLGPELANGPLAFLFQNAAGR